MVNRKQERKEKTFEHMARWKLKSIEVTSGWRRISRSKFGVVAMRGYVFGSLMNSAASVVKTVFNFILRWCALGVSSCMAVGLPAAWQLVWRVNLHVLARCSSQGVSAMT